MVLGVRLVCPAAAAYIIRVASTGNPTVRRDQHTPRKRFRCGSEDHLIATFPKPPKDNEKRKNQVRFNEKGIRAYDNSKNNSN